MVVKEQYENMSNLQNVFWKEHAIDEIEDIKWSAKEEVQDLKNQMEMKLRE